MKLSSLLGSRGTIIAVALILGAVGWWVMERRIERHSATIGQEREARKAAEVRAETAAAEGEASAKRVQALAEKVEALAESAIAAQDKFASALSQANTTAERMRREAEQARRELDEAKAEIPNLSEDELAARIDDALEDADPQAHFWAAGPDVYQTNRRGADLMLGFKLDFEEANRALTACQRQAEESAATIDSCQSALDASEAESRALKDENVELRTLAEARLRMAVARADERAALAAEYSAYRKRAFWKKLRSNGRVLTFGAVGGYIAGVVTSR
ncbi:MAG TPA: hypothetical protein VLV83_24840 [Acidobacteriota bacterium]|nr:hypothetical protein [Acidobacteriota bacterium]